MGRELSFGSIGSAGSRGLEEEAVEGGFVCASDHFPALLTWACADHFQLIDDRGQRGRPGNV